MNKNKNENRVIASDSLRALAVVLVMLTVASSAASAQGLPLKDCSGTMAYLCRGDIVIADPNAGTNSPGVPGASHGEGALFLIDPSNGVQTLISQGNLLTETVGVVVESSGMLVVSDRNTGIVRVDPATGAQSLLSAATLSNDFFGIARDAAGNFIVTDSGFNPDKAPLVPPGIPGRVLRIDKTTGAQTVIAQGGNIVHPYGVAVDPNDLSIIVSDMSSFSSQGAIIRVPPAGGSQTIVWGPSGIGQVTQSAPFNCPMGITVENSGNILATVFSYFAYGCSNPGIFRVNLMTNSQEVVSANPPVGWNLPFGIITEESNNILVVDEGLRGIYRLSPNGVFIAPTPLSGRDQPSTPNFLASPVGIAVPRFQPNADIGQPPGGTSFTIGPSSMEGHLKITAGDWVSGGFSFKFKNNNHVAADFTITSKVTLAVTCPNGGGPGGVIVVDLGSKTHSVPAGNTDWLPTGDANSVLSWMGSAHAPDLCNGNLMDNAKGAVFKATVTQNPQTSSPVDFRFKYRDPNAKGKGNVDCLDTSDPRRAKADVCGASWSQTVTVP